MTSSIIKLRPVVKTPEELADEANLPFQLPRKKCNQMIPELVRLNAVESTHVQQHRYHILKRLMKKARIHKIDKKIEHMQNLDAAEAVVPHGEVSKRIYNEIVLRRDFDLYGGPMKSQTWPLRKYLELQALAQRLNVEFTQKLDPAFIEIDDKDIVKDVDHRKVPALQTEKWKIGYEERHPAPVGFSNNPQQPYNSLENEGFYCYDGDWKHGKMHGMGKYLFRDGCSYEGEFEDNHPHGYGTTSYPDGQGYKGDWAKGRYEGRGETSTCGGSKYVGEFVFGRRHGKGKLTFPSGLYYEGEFFDGQPHGRGVMRSKLTGWAYEGSFERGSICGSGTIIEPNGKRTVSFRAQTKEIITLPLLVRTFIKEQDEERERRQEAANQMYGPLRGIQLKAYVNNIRNTLYTERVREKKQKYNDTINKIKEQKAKLYEARLKALAGDDDDSSSQPPGSAASTKSGK